MTSRKTRKKITILIVLFILAGLFAYGVYWAFFDIQRIQGQEIIDICPSPSGRYTVTVYLNNGGATTDYAVLGEVTDSQTGKTRNIYWQYHCSSASVQWQDDETVVINGVALNVRKDVYDYRRQ